LDDPGRVRSHITSLVDLCQIQRFDFDCNLVVTRKLIIRIPPGLGRNPLYHVQHLMLLGGLVALWPTHNTTSHVIVRSFRPHQRPPHPGRSRAEHASASRPSQQPIRPSRARIPVPEVIQVNSIPGPFLFVPTIPVFRIYNLFL
jgi:hypothetical protein